MKILMLASFYEPYVQGGAERAARTLAAQLPAMGHDVVVLTVSGAHETGDRVVDGVRVRAIPLRNIYDLRTPQPAYLKSLWHVADTYNLAMQGPVAGVIAEEKPDVVHTEVLTGFSASAWAAARDAGVPIVHTLHDHYVLCARSTMSYKGVPCAPRHLECAILSRPRVMASRVVSHVVGVSSYILDAHRAFHAFEGVPGSVIPNPCHLVGAPVEARSRAGKVRFGFMGRLERWKGIEVAIRAMAATRMDCTLSVAGRGEAGYVEQVHAMAQGLPVEFLGNVDPASFLRDIDVMIVPSMGLETFGLSAVEAMAMGVPVIASDRGALPEIIDPGRTGWIFDADDPDGLAKAMRSVVANREQIASMSAACRASVQHCDPATIAMSYRDLYASVLKR